MSRTNSNSITSILIYELNNNENFRKKMLKEFKKLAPDAKINDKIIFYDGTHSPLKIKSMKKTEVDIYARVPGEYKIYLMIEVKAGINEDLQDSQKKNGEYQITSDKEKIPLFFIIPKLYAHREEIGTKKENIIEWESILKLADNESKLKEQIKHFVDIMTDDTTMSLEMIDKSKSLIECRKNIIEELDEYLKNIDDKKFVDNPYEFGYYWDKDTCFLGFCDFEEKYTLVFAIKETIDNIELGKNEFYFIDEWYYIPVSPIKNIKSINDLDEKLQKKYLKNISINELKNAKINTYATKLQETSKLLESLHKLYDGFFKGNEKIEKGKFQDREGGIGYYFYDEKYFIGLYPSVKNKDYHFSISIKLGKREDNSKWNSIEEADDGSLWAYFPLNKEILLNCISEEDLQTQFNKEVNRVLRKIESIERK